MRYIARMKSATLPPLRVESSFRSEIEGVLKEGESLSSFVESSIRRTVQYRKTQSEFVARGLESLAKIEAGAPTHSAESVVTELQAKLNRALAAKGLKKRDV